MKTSVITVAYNSAATIRATLRSVAAQTWASVEHIVIDGGSADGTADIVRQEGKHVATLISEPDHGIYDAMNKGLRLASGDVICFLNADDRYADPGVLARVAVPMAAGDLDMLMGDVAFFRPSRPDRLIRRYRSVRFQPDRIAWGWMPAHPALFVSREVFEAVGPFRTDYRIAADYEWVARAFVLARPRYRHLHEVLVHMQMGGASTQGWRSTWLLNREVMRACRENGIATNWFKILSKYPAKLQEYLRP